MAGRVTTMERKGVHPRELLYYVDVVKGVSN